MQNPKHIARLARGTWVRNTNVVGLIHVGRDMVVVLRDQDECVLGVVCMTCDNRLPPEHRMIFSGTPPRSCSASLPSTPPTRRPPNLSLSQAVGKQSPAPAKRHLPKLLSKTPMVARRGESGTLGGLRLWTTMTTRMTRKWAAPTWSAKCWDWIVEGYSIPNTGKNVKVGRRTLDDKDYEGVSNAVDSSKCD
jgi:hypothetical protein